MTIGYELGDIVWDPNALKNLLRSPQGETARHVAHVCRDIEAEAKRLTNNVMVGVITGRLSGSITHVVVQEAGEIVGYVGTRTEYAIYVELGTSRMPARPFLQTALETVIN